MRTLKTSPWTRFVSWPFEAPGDAHRSTAVAAEPRFREALDGLGPVMSAAAAAVDMEAAWRRVEARLAVEEPRETAHRLAQPASSGRLTWELARSRRPVGLSLAAVTLAALGLLVWRPISPTEVLLPEHREVRLNVALWRPAASAPQANGGATEELIVLLRQERR